ncbi:MAG: hypothetical protein IKN55_01355 [Oscillospiraceae bacterium]|nr:hypothetical protein [Oscillospiraceae bacterium]
MTVENERERLFLRIPLFVMRFSGNHLELREDISETAVKNILYKSGKAPISIATDDDHFTRFVNKDAHVLIPVPNHTLSGCFVPTAEAADTGMDRAMIRYNSVI